MYDFPSSPTVGQKYQGYSWDGEKWTSPTLVAQVQPLGGLLTYVSGTQLKFAPFNGNIIRINGVFCTIPDAGVFLSNGGLAASTVYFVYATASGGVVNALEASGTAHAPSTTAGNKGTEIKIGDDTRSLVGIFCTGATTIFNDDQQRRNVRSWFNRRSSTLTGLLNVNSSLGTGLTEVNAALRTEFTCFPNEAISINSALYWFNNTLGALLTCYLSIDGGVVGNPTVINMDGTGAVRPLGGPTYAGPLTETRHTISVQASISAGTGSFYSASAYSATLNA